MENRMRLARKPATCPSCGSSRIATMQYGYPMPSIKLKNQIKTGEIILGGCEVTGDDPAWQCVDCGYQIYRLGILKRMITIE